MDAAPAEDSAPATPAAAAPPILPSQDSGDLAAKSSSKQRQRTRRACYPCSKRKIKCDRDERTPCTNCAKRPNSELCTFDDDRPRSARPRHSTNTASPTPGSIAADDLKHERTPPQPLLRGIQNIGGHLSLSGDERKLVLQPGDPPRSVATLDHRQPSHRASASLPRYSLIPDALNGSATGVNGNSFIPINPSSGLGSGHPQLPLPGPATLAPLVMKSPADDLRALLPPVKHVSKYCELYTNMSHSLFPVDIGIPHIQELTFQYIHQSLGDKLALYLDHGELEPFKYEAIRVALLCAAVAAGVQTSDLEEASRRPLLRQYVANAMKLLRIADAQSNISIAAYPALMILSRVVQDELEPILSYTMLGSLQRMMHIHAITAVFADRYAEDTRHMRTPEALVRIRHRQEAFLALILGQNHLLEKPAFPDVRNWTNTPYIACIDVLAGITAYCGTENIDREELLLNHADAMMSIQPLDRWTLPHLADKSACRNVPELTEFWTLRLHECLVTIHYCQIIMAACRRLSGHEEEYFKTGDTCRTKCRDCIDAYLDMVAVTIVPLRSWVLTMSALRAALILGALMAELRQSVADCTLDRERLLRLTNAFTNIHDETHADRLRWSRKYRSIFDRIQKMADASARPSAPRLASNGAAPSPTDQSTALQFMSRDDRDNIMMPQRMVQHYIAVPSSEDPVMGSLLFSQQSLLEI